LKQHTTDLYSPEVWKMISLLILEGSSEQNEQIQWLNDF